MQYLATFLIPTWQMQIDHLESKDRTRRTSAALRVRRYVIDQIPLLDQIIPNDSESLPDDTIHIEHKAYEIRMLERNKNDWLEYLKQSGIPRLSVLSYNKMDGPLTLDEIRLAIQTLHNGKTPGVDGLSAMFVKKFQSELIEPIQLLINHALEQGRFSDPIFRQTLITPIFKAKKDESDDTLKERRMHIQNYRPIALLGMIAKIWASAITHRMELVVQKIIPAIQVGFMKRS